jgi:predicted HAD superfamily Cof-like phosphohydrolase
MEANRLFIEATIKKDLVEIEKALNHLLDFSHATADACGIRIDPVFAEVQRSNMSKLWDGPNGPEVKRRPSDGKILKPPTYSPADLKKVLMAQLLKECEERDSQG